MTCYVWSGTLNRTHSFIPVLAHPVYDVCVLLTAVGDYGIVEPVNGNCSVQSVAGCRNLVSQSPNLNTDDIDQLCRYYRDKQFQLSRLISSYNAVCLSVCLSGC